MSVGVIGGLHSSIHSSIHSSMHSIPACILHITAAEQCVYLPSSFHTTQIEAMQLSHTLRPRTSMSFTLICHSLRVLAATRQSALVILLKLHLLVERVCRPSVKGHFEEARIRRRMYPVFRFARQSALTFENPCSEKPLFTESDIGEKRDQSKGFNSAGWTSAICGSCHKGKLTICLMAHGWLLRKILSFDIEADNKRGETILWRVMLVTCYGFTWKG